MGHIQLSQDHFKERLNQARNTVEWAFSRLKRHFRCLHMRLEVSLANVPAGVGACCTLQNLVDAKNKPRVRGGGGPRQDAVLFFLLTDLTLTEINWQQQENARAHHSAEYSSRELIVRRGQPFTIILNCNRELRTGESFTFTAETGPKPSLQAKTRALFGISSTASSSTWSAVQQSTNSRSISVSISSPANAAIGRYKLSVQPTSGGSASSGTFILLFNAWSPGDEVFLSNSAERQEYVMEEFGIVTLGNINHRSSIGWNYGQFQEDILNICLAILDRSLSYRKDPATDVSRRNDPKHVGRVLSAMINSNDDKGVLVGNWSGDYRDGTSPSNWSGSVEILRKWKGTGFQPVKYGQCWVFASVLTTVLRSLGIPTRTISNFNSAHDVNRNLTVDEYYDISGNPLRMGGDSVWNFHVWNESWFTRSDLGPSYNGWQILDATPQERSEGIFQCGPASLKAIKEGDVDLDHDTPFVFAEVNADRITWKYDIRTGEQKPLFSDTKSVGQFITTKAVGSYEPIDVTKDYKYVEGSRKEREVFKKALSKVSRAHGFAATSEKRPEIDQKPDISGKFKVDGPLKIGKDISLNLVLGNLTSVTKTVKANATAWTTMYTGKLIHEVWKDSLSATFASKEEKQFPIKIEYAAYQQHLTRDNMIQVTALCQVESGIEVVVQRSITLDNPDLVIQVIGDAKVNEPLTVEVTFTNPLDQEVKDCVLQAEGSDLLKGKLKIEMPSLKPRQSSTELVEIIPTKNGTKQLLVNFSCDKFPDVKAFETINVSN
ncbi:protein-glutamine gamma-glutamyltransferase E-like [Carettochelys insculpta]|uniref:protein-glutamine gamma-glutamyltransferase E-like n=1 Tax=Carettochelys insculpta TaxID=44489 RepID=UPI003EBABA6B